jgi:antitoxin (DNA-binding transcriptional repressor) of toxin-antitoxin stability system
VEQRIASTPTTDSYWPPPVRPAADGMHSPGPCLTGSSVLMGIPWPAAATTGPCGPGLTPPVAPGRTPVAASGHPPQHIPVPLPVRLYAGGMSKQLVSVSTDGLEAWNDAVRRAENGETVAVIAHGKHVADVVPSGELDRLRETIEVLSDPEAVQALADTEPVVFGRDAIRALVAERVAREGQ